MKNIGIVILVVGIALTAFTSFKFFTTEKVVEIGSLEITKEKPHYWAWSPFLGVALMAVGGAVIILKGKR